MPSVDENLLAKDEDSADRAGGLREAKQRSKNEEPEDDVSFKETKDFIKNPGSYVGQEVGETNREMQRVSMFNQRTQEAKRKKKESDNKKKGGLAGKINQAKIALAQVLRMAWISLIKSFGLTLIYINIHWLLSQVMPGLFCKLGEEWFLRPGTKGDPAKEKIVKKAGKKINLVETMGCGCLNLFAFYAGVGIIILIFWPVMTWAKIIELAVKILKFFGIKLIS